MKKNLIIFISILILSVITFFNLWKTFFQQDEWYWFGKVIFAQKFGFWHLFRVTGFHFIPLSAFIVVLLYQLVGLQFPLYAFFSLFLHSTNALLVYFLSKKIANNEVIAILSSVIFLVASTSHQAVTWIGASLAILPATFFGLISFLSFLQFVNTAKKKYLISSLTSLFIGLLFKEDIVFLFAYYPLYALFFQKKYFTRILTISSILSTVYIGSRLAIQVLSPQAINVGQGATLTGISSLIVNIFLLPLQAISKLYISPEIVLKIAHRILDRYRDWVLFIVDINKFRNFDIFVKNVGVTTVSASLTIIILIIGYVTLKIIRDDKEKMVRQIKMTFLYIILSILPYALLPKKLGMESRHFYLPLVGAALLLGMIIFYIADRVRQRLVGFKTREAVYYGLLTLMVIPVLLFYSAKIRQDIEGSIKKGNEQKAILSEIKKAYPKLGRKSVFFVEPLMYPTFYSGFGHTLMVVYAHEGQLNPKFFKDDFLWDIREQGYREIEGNGFGYFRQYSKLAEAIKEFQLSPENIYAFRYDQQTKKLESFTDGIKKPMKYFGLTGYISQPRPGKRLYLGYPDGQRRSFSSEEFIPTEIKEVINLTDNEEWVPADFIARQTRKNIPGTEDYLITYNYGLELTYGGTRLVYHLPGNGTDVYSIPAKVYGYKVAGFSGISSSVKGSSIMKKIVQKKDGSFEVTLLSTYSPSQTIEFTLLLNAKVLYYRPGEGINDIVAGQDAKVKGDGKSKKFVIPLSGILKSLRSYWESNDLRYQPKALVDGVMTQITSWSGIDTPSLTIEFEETPARDAVIKVPILVTYAPKPDDIIKIVNF